MQYDIQADSNWQVWLPLAGVNFNAWFDGNGNGNGYGRFRLRIRGNNFFRRWNNYYWG